MCTHACVRKPYLPLFGAIHLGFLMYMFLDFYVYGYFACLFVCMFVPHTCSIHRSQKRTRDALWVALLMVRSCHEGVGNWTPGEQPVSCWAIPPALWTSFLAQSFIALGFAYLASCFISSTEPPIPTSPLTKLYIYTMMPDSSVCSFYMGHKIGAQTQVLILA